MRYLELDPGPSLRPFVECLWALEANAAGRVERVVPDGRAEIVLHLGDPMARVESGAAVEEARALAVGQQVGPVVLRSGATTSIVAARLRPHALPSLLGVPGRTLLGRIEPLEGILGRSAFEWLDRVASAGSQASGIAALRNLLEERLRSRPARDDAWVGVARAAARTASTGGAVRVEALARCAGLGPRQLERRFREQVGLSPKRYARIVRFAAVVAALERSSSPSLAAVAADCGYADQPHLNRDFRELAGCSPTVYLAERNAWNAAFSGGTP